MLQNHSSFIGYPPLFLMQGCIGFVQCTMPSGDYIVVDILYTCMSLEGAPKLVGNSQKTVTSLSISGRIIFTFFVTCYYHVTCRNWMPRYLSELLSMQRIWWLECLCRIRGSRNEVQNIGAVHFLLGIDWFETKCIKNLIFVPCFWTS